VTIGGSLCFHDLGTGESVYKIHADGESNLSTAPSGLQPESNLPPSSNPIIIRGKVLYDNSSNTFGFDDVEIEGSTEESLIAGVQNSTVLIGGSLTIKLCQNTPELNFVFIGEDEANAVGVDGSGVGNGYAVQVVGATSITGGNGTDYIKIVEAQFIGAVTINTKSSLSSGDPDRLVINGSQFGGKVTVTMAGDNAEIDINENYDRQETEFVGAFNATMTGIDALIDVADETGDAPVVFEGNVNLVGNAVSFGTFTYGIANVTFATAGNPHHTNFIINPVVV